MKVWNYIVIITGLAIFLQLAGFNVGLQGILNLVGIEFSSSGVSGINDNPAFIDAIIGTGGILASVGAGIAVGFLNRSSPENFIILPFITGTAFLFGTIFYNIVQYALNYQAWIAAIAAMIFLPIGVGFYTALVEFFRGTD